MTVTVRPGDTLIVGRAERYLTDEEGNAAIERMKEQLPGIKIVLIAGVTALAVYRDTEVLSTDEGAAVAR